MSNQTRERLDLTDFEFDIPCSVSGELRGKCTEPAAWWVLTGPHGCAHANPAENLLCESHYAYLLAGGKWRCTRCGQAVVAAPLVLRTERIR
jgi:hypothetical protein